MLRRSDRAGLDGFLALCDYPVGGFFHHLFQQASASEYSAGNPPVRYARRDRHGLKADKAFGNLRAADRQDYKRRSLARR